MVPKTSFTFYLDWVVCAQFGGFIWAKECGLYDDAGLDVTFVPWCHDGRSVIQKGVDHASGGELCAGSVADNLVVSECATSASARVFGAMLQDTPLVLMSRPSQHISSFNDLRGKRVGMHTDGIRALEIVLTLEGFAMGYLDVHEVGFDLEHLIQGRFDALQGYSMTEPVQLETLGVDVDVLPIRHLRLQPYAQTYVSETTLLSEHQGRFADFLAASNAGWLAVCARPDMTDVVIDLSQRR